VNSGYRRVMLRDAEETLWKTEWSESAANTEPLALPDSG
jgi:hypothetical protein